MSELREFQCDTPCVRVPATKQPQYPKNALANDPVVPTYGCADGNAWFQFRFTPDNTTYVQCSDGWHDEAGAIVLEGEVDLLAVAGAKLGLLRDDLGVSVQVLGDASSTLPVSDLPKRDIKALRAQGDGFWAALAGEDSMANPQLWLIKNTGEALYLGTYPPPPTGHNPGWYPDAHGSPPLFLDPVLDGEGALYEFGLDPILILDYVIKRNLDGTSTVVFTEADDPLVKNHATSLVTGPGALADGSPDTR